MQKSNLRLDDPDAVRTDDAKRWEFGFLFEDLRFQYPPGFAELSEACCQNHDTSDPQLTALTNQRWNRCCRGANNDKVDRLTNLTERTVRRATLYGR